MLTLARAQRLAPPGGGIPSPCVGVCRMRPSGLCGGCWRTIEEIAGWSRASDDDKRAIWVALEQRQAQDAPPATGAGR